MIAYKVVKKRRGRFRSCIIHGENEVTYVRGKISRAPKWLARQGYHLCVFKFLSDARDFAGGTFENRIWEVNVNGVIFDIPPMLDKGGLVWKSIKISSSENWPVGTIMAKSVKLLWEVKT